MAWRHPDRIWQAAPLGAAPLALVSEAKHHAVLDFTDDDALLESYTAAAMDAVERYTQRLLIKRACTLRLPCLPTTREAIELPGGPVDTITLTVDGVAVDPFTAEAIGDSPAVLMPGADWPVATGEGWPVEIGYNAGFEDGAIPTALRFAVMVLVKDHYDTRGLGHEPGQGIPAAAIALMAPWRIRPIK